MLCANFMPRTHDPALEQTKCGFNRVRVEVTIDPLLCSVIDCLVLLCGHPRSAYRGRIARELIGYDHVNIGRDVFLDVLRQRTGLRIISVEETQWTAALTDTDDNFLGSLASIDTVAN